jgi:hypothetical protein
VPWSLGGEKYKHIGSDEKNNYDTKTPGKNYSFFFVSWGLSGKENL